MTTEPTNPELETAAANEADVDATQPIPAQAAASAPAPEAEAEGDPDKDAADAIEALEKLGKLFGRMARSVPLRTFLMELEKLDRRTFFRYFKGYRYQSITQKRFEEVLRKEIFGVKNGLVAQLLIFNWDETEWRLYGAMKKHVQAINPDVEAIEKIDDAQADAIVADLIENYPIEDIAVCTIINGVRFTPEKLAEKFGAFTGA